MALQTDKECQFAEKRQDNRSAILAKLLLLKGFICRLSMALPLL